MKAKDILAEKGQDVYSIDGDATVLEAARLLSQKRIGALPVTSGPRVVGIFTERDLAARVVAAERDPKTTRVAEVMTTPIICCQPDTTKAECVRVMTERRIRHLPVVEDDVLVGIISIGDIMAQEVAGQRDTIRYLHEYMFERPR
jgi:CBS domain-containing protein